MTKIGHRWSGWPGAYCLDCGCDDPLEATVACTNCDLQMPGDPPDKIDHYCEEHTEHMRVMRTCPPDAKESRAFNARWRHA